jgi:hypothetical protein
MRVWTAIATGIALLVFIFDLGAFSMGSSI